jgi:hypothetical protein
MQATSAEGDDKDLNQVSRIKDFSDLYFFCKLGCSNKIYYEQWC